MNPLIIESLPVDDGSNSLVQKGVICLANSSRFDDKKMSEPLTEYAVGWVDPSGIDAQLEHIAPEVPVAERFEYGVFDNAEAFVTDPDDVRPFRSDFKQVEYNSGLRQGKVRNRGLTILLDRDEDGRNEELYTRNLLTRVKRNSLVRSLSLLSAAAVNTGVTWTSAGGSQPDARLRRELINGADACGIRGNRVFYGESAWDIRTAAYEGQENSGATAGANRTPAQVGARLGVDLYVGESRKTVGSTRQQIGGNLVISYIAFNGLTRLDPSNIKRFTYTPTSHRWRVFREEIGAKLIRITVEHYEDTIITSTLGIRQLTVADS